MNESTMRKFAGWNKDSVMPSVYLHLSDKNVKKVIYEIDDIENPIEKEIEARVETQMSEKKDEIDTLKSEIVTMKEKMIEMSGIFEMMQDYWYLTLPDEMKKKYSDEELWISYAFGGPPRQNP